MPYVVSDVDIGIERRRFCCNRIKLEEKTVLSATHEIATSEMKSWFIKKGAGISLLRNAKISLQQSYFLDIKEDSNL